MRNASIPVWSRITPQHASRRAAFAGTWYPDDPDTLAAFVDRCLVPADVAFADILAIVSPHAGLMYSGAVAGRAFASLQATLNRAHQTGSSPPEVVVLVGPSHSAAFEGAAVDPSRSFETPLGSLRNDLLFVERLAAHPGMHVDIAVHAREHSLELQLPFLARVLPDVPVVLVLMGRQTRTEADGLARRLTEALRDRRALLVASSDLSHYYDRQTASRLDAVVVDRLEQFDADGLQGALEHFPHHACGGGPMVAVMRTARALGATTSRVLQYADSGDVSGDVERVVGYVSAALGRAA
jgi:AmmeMemoRadiSam system protein B